MKRKKPTKSPRGIPIPKPRIDKKLPSNPMFEKIAKDVQETKENFKKKGKEAL